MVAKKRENSLKSPLGTWETKEWYIIVNFPQDRNTGRDRSNKASETGKRPQSKQRWESYNVFQQYIWWKQFKCLSSACRHWLGLYALGCCYALFFLSSLLSAGRNREDRRRRERQRSETETGTPSHNPGRLWRRPMTTKAIQACHFAFCSKLWKSMQFFTGCRTAPTLTDSSECKESRNGGSKGRMVI